MPAPRAGGIGIGHEGRSCRGPERHQVVIRPTCRISQICGDKASPRGASAGIGRHSHRLKPRSFAAVVVDVAAARKTFGDDRGMTGDGDLFEVHHGGFAAPRRRACTRARANARDAAVPRS
jgi:hypothetical protein